MQTIIDTHAHLYELPDASGVLSDCALAGVSDVVALGVDLESNRKHLALGQQTTDNRQQVDPLSAAGCRLPHVHLAFGLHPGNIVSSIDTDDCFAFMREHIQEAVAIGETGLDFWYKWVRKDDGKKREQREVFERHLALAREFDLPIVIHSRGAWRDCLNQAVRAGNKKAVFHWYSGPLDVLKDVLAAGFFVSFTPALGYSPEHRQAAELAPLDRVLIETDTPVAYLLETPDTGHQTLVQSGVKCQVSGVPKVPSTPKDVWRTLKLLSELKGVAEDRVLQTVNTNAKQFFNI